MNNPTTIILRQLDQTVQVIEFQSLQDFAQAALDRKAGDRYFVANYGQWVEFEVQHVTPVRLQ